MLSQIEPYAVVSFHSGRKVPIKNGNNWREEFQLCLVLQQYYEYLESLFFRYAVFFSAVQLHLINNLPNLVGIMYEITG